VQTTENRFVFGFNAVLKTEASKNLTYILTETAFYPQLKLKEAKITLLAFNVQIKNVLKQY